MEEEALLKGRPQFQHGTQTYRQAWTSWRVFTQIQVLWETWGGGSRNPRVEGCVPAAEDGCRAFRQLEIV